MSPAAFADGAAPAYAGATADRDLLDADPLIAARAAFFVHDRHTAPRGPRTDQGLPSATERDELTCLLQAEYGPRRPTPCDRADAVGREDAAVAVLRRACRMALPLPAESLLAHVPCGPRLTAVLTEMWPETVHWHGPRHAQTLLRAALTKTPGAPSTALLLDLATSSRLLPLTAAEAAALAADAHDRAVRHAAWRYLHAVPGGARHLPAPTQAADVYERLLLSPPRPHMDHADAGTGLTVAQGMLLGALETPGQGLSGGLSVLLGGLGDRLARTDGIDAVVTVVTAGLTELERDPAPVYRRGPGHWVLRLPVDSREPLQQTDMHRHRAALTWWTVRMFAAMPRPLDVLHVRYADDGSMALADAAARLGARLVFTATPDPHRQLADRYALAAPPEASQGLRDDLHRVFLADRLVDRADTVVGIPARGGNRELVRHFPALARLNDGSGPAVPPEGIAAYRPAADEGDRRRALLARLFAGGDAPDALDPGDRRLPLLLTVGRLHPLKQQDVLVEAWLAAGLHTSTTLAVIGGGPGEGNASESRVRRRMEELLDPHPEARTRIALLPALPNDSVRRLQRALADPEHALRAWYVCPSLKEEFGIAVLEAMEAGLPAVGPRLGGVGHYLRDGVNGLLWDTSGPDRMAHGLRRIMNVPEARRRRFARAGSTLVKEKYSVAGMAEALAAQYAAPARRPRSLAP
ncbi:glycosyltransferase [Streptomyces hilarionis]|uniref:glycosyltransferase n=1 Tax=Streptomyces hilarionis TaxID=2839954 RepID=UPI002119DA22|nr:glycosyltransferase [Streptomyces hilarionis]MCQ9131650.1 glycosyltransferase [Streptomyces hilarionis]